MLQSFSLFVAVAVGAALCRLFFPLVGEAIAIAFAVAISAYVLFGWLAAARLLLGAVLAVSLGSTIALASGLEVVSAAEPTGDSGHWLSLAWAYVSTPTSVAWFVGLMLAILPQGEDGTFWDRVRTLLNVIANNWGHAKNIRTV